MKISDLVKTGVPSLLFHPIVGFVRWEYDLVETCWLLKWDRGPERGKPLLPDESVMLDDKWDFSKEEN